MHVLHRRAQIILYEQLFLSKNDFLNKTLFPYWLQVLTPRLHTEIGDDNANRIESIRRELQMQARAVQTSLGTMMHNMQSELTETQQERMDLHRSDTIEKLQEVLENLRT
jgi:hypothetical protein